MDSFLSEQKVNLLKLKETLETAVKDAQTNVQRFIERHWSPFIQEKLTFLKANSAPSTESSLELRAVSVSPAIPEIQEPEDVAESEDYFLFMNRKRWQTRDGSAVESALNVVTSFPLIASGLSVPNSSEQATWYGRSLVAVGLSSALYHSTSGESKKQLRKLDYAFIALSSLLLTNALGEYSNPWFLAASAAVIPFKPSLTTAVHAGLTEYTYFKKAKETPSLQPEYNRHLQSVAAAGALMVADDTFPNNKVIHAAWHLAAAASLLTVNQLITNNK